MKKIMSVVITVVCCLMASCASYDFRQAIVQQGNLLPESKLQRLKMGMTKQQVATLMGTSMVSPLFNQDRWDYAYTRQKGLGKMEQKKVVLHFRNNRLSKIDTA